MEFDFSIFILYNQNKSIDRKKTLNSVLENTGQSVMGIMVIIWGLIFQQLITDSRSNQEFVLLVHLDNSEFG